MKNEAPDNALAALAGLKSLDGLTIVVTGGTGSFGNAFTDHLLATCPNATLRLFSRDELKQYTMDQRLRDPRVRYFLGDVRDLDRLRRAFRGAHVVIHAAALKQVPACEYNPFEAVKTNVLGAQNIVEAAIDCGVKAVVALSTDKAVNPVNLYGATKLCAEKIFVDGNAYASGTSRFSVVRYGNVLGSRGSVLPLFLKQRATGKLTITHPEMTRFWITLQEAVAFVVQSALDTQGGEIFVPKIPSLRVIDLARAIAPEAEREIVGIRPGEKMHEVLLTEDEARHAFEQKNRYLILPDQAMFSAPKHPTAKAVPAGFRFTSDTNTDWLDEKQIKTLIDPIVQQFKV